MREGENYKQNLRDIEELHQLSENPSFYEQNAGVTDATLAPAGQLLGRTMSWKERSYAGG